jgi:hypothetical protein
MENAYRYKGYLRYGHLLLLVLSASLAWSAPLFAQSSSVYTWTDETGVVHVSDSPREDGNSDRIRVEGAYKPGSSDAYPEANAAPAETAGVDSEEVPLSAAQQRREQIAEARVQRQEAEAEARKQCGRHRQRLTQMEPARRVFYINEEGEQVRMDDDERMGAIEESKAYLARYCDE